MKINNSGRLSANIAKCALFFVLMFVCAYIKIPLPVIPLTFQTVIALLSGILLGPKYSTLSMSAYCLAGVMGLPVFSNVSGINCVFSPSFGYILGFIAAGAIVGALYKKGSGYMRCVVVCLIGIGVNYVIGIAYFSALWLVVYRSGYWFALLMYNIVYLPKDIALCFVAALIAKKFFCIDGRV